MDFLPPKTTLPLLRTTLHSRLTGSLLGSALGDTIGLYTEFLSRPSALTAYPSRTFTLLPTPTPSHPDLHRLPKPPAHWTDDTDHALLLLLAFLHTAHTASPPPLPSQTDLALRLRVWAQQGLRALDTMPLGLGRLVGTVVATRGFDVEPERVAREAWEGGGRRAAPNGSLMRTHVLGGMCLWRGEGEAFEVAAGISRVTHADPRCVVACVIGTGLVRGLVRGEVTGEEEVRGVVERGRDWVVREGEVVDGEELRRHVEAEGLGELKLDEAEAIGYVYKALGAGVVVLRLAMRRLAEAEGGLLVKSKLFEELITDLVMQGGDADTNACFAGALLGAYLGYGSLPDHWKHGLKHGEWLMEKAEALSQAMGLKDGQYNGQEDKDTLPDAGKGITQDEMEGRWMVLQAEVAKKMDDHAKATSSKSAKISGWHMPWHSDKKRAKK